ncbi:MAG: MOSC domain-containing protein [Thermomicrobiales bacterium]|nr:MOSC domain-containing protein [Thermomicrobiales bacterium]
MTISSPVGPVMALHRYPVKSLRGECLDALRVEARGVVGDRLYALRTPEGKFGSGKSTRRFRRMEGLLDLASAYAGDSPVITFPDGAVVAGDDPAIHDRLSAHVRQPVTLAREAEISHYDDSPLHLITTSGLRSLGLSASDAQRFRPNVVIDVPGDGFVEDTWIGRDLVLGDVRLRITGGAVRCVMIGMAQEDLPEQPGLLRRVADLHGTCFGVYATVVAPGDIAVGMDVRLD